PDQDERPEDDARDAPHSAEDDQRESLDRYEEHEGTWSERPDLDREQRAAQASDSRPAREGQELVSDRAHAHRPRDPLVLPHRVPRSTDARVGQAPRHEGRDQAETEGKV